MPITRNYTHCDCQTNRVLNQAVEFHSSVKTLLKASVVYLSPTERSIEPQSNANKCLPHFYKNENCYK